MAYTTINKSTDYFDIRTYSASGAGSVSDVSFQPDFIWFKNRTAVGDHGLFDAIRGVTKYLQSNNSSTGLTGNGSNDFTAFTSNGFNYGASSQLDTGSHIPCTWLWKANGVGSANTAGSINSTVSANTTSGFSIVKYTGTGANATVGHGLGVAPKMIILKDLDSAQSWSVYNKNIGYGNFLSLNSTNALASSTSRFTADPSSSVFSIGDNASGNGSGNNFIAYCFAEKTGYSKIGSYVGNGSTDGTFVYTGFKPAFVIGKRTNAVEDWFLFDSARDTHNVNYKLLYPNGTNAEYTGVSARNDFLSNGFKMRITDAKENGSGSTYIYMAFAEAPLVGTNNVPCTAR